MQAETIAKEIAVITIHGMGREDKEYYKGFEERLQRKLEVKWERVAFGHIYYQDTLEPNEQFVYDQMQKAKTPFRSFIAWRLLREFLLFYFADPGSLENNKTARESAYYQTQAKIANELRRIYVELGRNKKAKVVIAAHSLGCQVISSYVWDAQYASEQFEAIRKMTRVGFWGKIGELQTDDPDELDFLKLTSLPAYTPAAAIFRYLRQAMIISCHSNRQTPTSNGRIITAATTSWVIQWNPCVGARA